MTVFAWHRRSKPWVFGCCLMNARRFLGATAGFIWQALTTLISTGLTTLRSLRAEFRSMLFQFYYRIHRRFTTAQQALVSIYCSAGTPMEDSFAFRVGFPSSWNRACRERWELA